MSIFRFVISDKNRSWQIEKPQNECPVLGKKIGSAFDAGFLGIEGYELARTGGSDKEGFPMRKDIEGTTRRSIMVGKGVGHRLEGRVRKTLRGNTVAQDIVQVNCKVTKAGTKPLDELLPRKEKKEEAKE